MFMVWLEGRLCVILSMSLAKKLSGLIKMYLNETCSEVLMQIICLYHFLFRIF
jgi:hypothetical protein